MKKIWESIKKTLLYCGLSKESYSKVKMIVSKENRKTVGVYTLSTAIIFLVVFFINIFKKQNVSGILYIIPSLCSILMWVMNYKLVGKYPVISDIISVLYASLLLAAGVYIGIDQNQERTTLLLPFFVYASTVFSFRLVYLVIMMIGFESLYLVLAFQTQSGKVLTANVVNTIIFCAIGLVVGTFLMKLKYKKHETDINNKYLSEMDELTNIYNRRSFSEHIEYLKNNSIEHKIGVIMFDIDFFKKYNDFYGHTKGDIVLADVAKAIKDYVRQYTGCQLFRYGGEEFVVVTDGIDEMRFKDIAVDINRIIYQLNIPRDDIKEFSRITISVGAAIEIIPNITDDYITNADNQLYMGKGVGRNSVYYKNKSLLNNANITYEEDDISGNYIMYQVLTYLCQDFYDIYSVDCNTKRVTVYRSGGKVLGISRVLKNDYDYESSFRAYIENNIHPFDRKKVYKKIEFNNVYEAVKQYGVVSIYYRVLRDDKTSFYKIKFIPMGTKENFTSMICAFLPEDIEVGNEQNSQIAELDELTNIYTKQAFYHYAKKEIEEQLNTSFRVVAVDIENFRFLNSIYGKLKCDNVLNYFAREFANSGKCHVVGRYGYDQFILLMEDDEEFYFDTYSKFFQDIKEKAPIPYLSIKLGVCKINNIDEPINIICENAFLALKDIKHREDKLIAEYDDNLIKKQLRIQMLESSFDKALSNNEFKIYCQPKYDIASNSICGGEALLRWKCEDGEIIMPGEFISTFEKIGAISRLDEYVFRFVCSKQRELIDAGIKPLPVSVNISRNTLYIPTTLDKYLEIVESYRIDKSLVPMEITESFALDNFNIREVVMKFKNAGFIIHLDDFGEGYSSLSCLSYLTIDAVKIDKSLIFNIGNKKSDELLIRIIDLLHHLNTEIIVEGVETKKQYDFVKNLNCQIVQGFYFSNAIEFNEFTKLL